MRKHIDGTNDLEPIIKWPGGKEKELQHIIDNAPANYVNYYEPFVGGGSVFMAIQAENYFINDFSTELINLYNCINDNNHVFYGHVNAMENTWSNMEVFLENLGNEIIELYLQYRNDAYDQEQLSIALEGFITLHRDEMLNILDGIDLIQDEFISEIRRNVRDKMRRMKKIEGEKGILPEKDLHDNIEASFKGAIYMYYRKLYNNQNIDKPQHLQTALFFFMRNYAYSGMFRFSRNGDFNVPYGGIAYNSKHLIHKLNYYQSAPVTEHFGHTQIFNLDFEEFLTNNPPTPDDFIFLDPPYDSEFSTYDQNEFSRPEQERLADYLINRCNGQWMMIIKNTEFIYNLYANHPGINIMNFNKEYIVSFMNRNDKRVEHLIITNYQHD